MDVVFGGADSGLFGSGSFTYDADTNIYSDISVTTQAGTVPAGIYIATGPNADADTIDLVSTLLGDLTGANRLIFNLVSPMTNAGGTIAGTGPASERFCGDATCTFGGATANRGLSGGTQITAVPAPSSVALVLTGVGLLGANAARRGRR